MENKKKKKKIPHGKGVWLTSTEGNGGGGGDRWDTFGVGGFFLKEGGFLEPEIG